MAGDEFWRDHVDAFLRQRGTQQDYCQQHGIAPRELRKWRTLFYGPVRMRTAPEPEVGLSETGVSEISYAAPVGPEAARADQAVVVAAPIVRRRWTNEQKRQLVWGGLNSGQPLARYARRHGIHPSVAHRWLRTFAKPLLAGQEDDPTTRFAEVRVAEVPRSPAASPTLITSLGSAIEIELSGGRRVRVGPEVDADALRRVLAVLEPSA